MIQPFFINYAQISLGIEQAKEVVDKLLQFKIIGFAKYNKRFRLLEGTDLDIEQAIADAEIDNLADIVYYITKYFDFPYIQAKEYFYRTGCPRFFQFMISDRPYMGVVKEADGIINLIFSETNVFEEIFNKSLGFDEPILYCLYHNTKDIRNLLVELERIQYVKQQHPNDKVAQREIDAMLTHLRVKLNELVFEELFTENENISWIFNGHKVDIHNHKLLNKQLSQICEWAYPATPVFKNEMVNKSKLSGAMQPARKNLLRALVSDFDKPNLGFLDDKFPPEKTIYLALLKNTGIHNGFSLTEPTDDSFDSLWNACNRVLEDAKTSRMNVAVLTERLQRRPFKLKQGFIDFWLPIFAFHSQG